VITLAAIGISSRSEVVAQHGVVATSSPLASQAGVEILKQGGNAIDAAVAAAAVLDVVEPFSTGCGGDAFALVHLPKSRAPLSYNGSGRSGSLATLEDLLAKGWSDIPLRGGAPVTVPGALRLWYDLVKLHGALEFSEVLEPAIQYARDGFPVSPIISRNWEASIPALRNEEARRIFTLDGRAPRIGQIMRNRDLAQVFEAAGREGPDSFYTGKTAEAIVATAIDHGGFLSLEDVAEHKTLQTQPISSSYRGIDVFEHPPNGQGFAALVMLNIMEHFDFREMGALSPGRYHLMIEAKKIAYADLHQHNADPAFYECPLDKLLSKEYAAEHAKIINTKRAMDQYERSAGLGSDTIYLCTADGEGGAVSFINSLYRGFGSGLVVPGTGIKLQNRGNLFSLDPDHPNCYAPRKLPFHTIIPAALYREGQFYGVFGIMGGAHQPQGHAQFVSNLVDYDMGPQRALDHPRFNHDHLSNTVGIEIGFPEETLRALTAMGHKVADEPRLGFGGGQAILRSDGVWIAGSDRRKDGQAAGY
jgi:gamma-glutamyltranspeptidase/glutathione hydrolase